MKSTPYSIDWTTNTITLTKKFAKEAQVFGSPAYKLLKDLRAQGFSIKNKEKQERKACPTRITFKKMEQYLTCLDHTDERLAELHLVMEAGKAQKNQYEYVRKWFLQNYPDLTKIPVVNNNYEIVSSRLQIAAKKEETAAAEEVA